MEPKCPAGKRGVHRGARSSGLGGLERDQPKMPSPGGSSNEFT